MLNNSVQSHPGRAALICENQPAVTASGLFGFGLCAILVNLLQADLVSVAPAILAMGVLYGGTSQIIVGLLEWHKDNFFSAVTFVSFGLFWLSLVGFLILPEAGWGTLPEGSVLSAYFLFWGAFAGLLLASAVKIKRSTQVMFILLVCYLVLFFIGEANGAPVISLLATCFGLASGGAALYAGAELIANQVLGRSATIR